MPKGSCLCGAVAYEVDGAFEGIDHCHCSKCRRSHGSAFATFGRTARQNLRLLRGADSVKEFASSEAVTRSFCETCGSSLFFRHAAVPEYEFVAVGTLDDDPGARPEAHIFVASKASWYEIEDDLPQHAEYPPGVAD